jgi:hypothetical protein
VYVLVCDLDDDGDLDFVSVDSLVSGTGRVQSSHSIVYYENVGTASDPNFIQHREKELNPFYDILTLYPSYFVQYEAQLIDIDGDGDCDWSIVSYSNNDDQPVYFENVGSPRHAVFKMRLGGNTASPLHADTAPQRKATNNLHKWVDINKDGFIDYVQQDQTDYGRSYLFLSVPPSTPTFTEDATVFDSGLDSMNRRSQAHSLWDFDNDGDFDLLVLGNDWKPFWYYENTGTKYKAVWTQRLDAATNPFLSMNIESAISKTANAQKSKYFVVYDLDADGDGDVIISSHIGKVFSLSEKNKQIR